MTQSNNQESSIPPEEPPLTAWQKLRSLLIGPPRDVLDRRVYHRIALVAFLAWVGLGADGLSSSAYGPEEAFRALGEHRYLAIALAGLMATTVLIISAGYSRIIEQFPHGGGGYVVASKLLGPRSGVVSGSALLVDYVLTITISIAAAGDALFSLLPISWHEWKLPTEYFLIALLLLLNLRGVRESVITLTPIFVLFVLTHTVLIVGAVVAHGSEFPATFQSARSGFHQGLATVGLGGLALLFVHAYSLGGGTYTGIEAVSNGLAIMREPRVRTAKHTMIYMGASLAFTASGLLLCYLLWNVTPAEGKTMNAVLTEKFAQAVPLGHAFVIVTLVSEGALLVVAAQAGFVDGPRVMANMANDSWVPHRFAALSDRLTTANGILLMAAASLIALVYTGGDVRHLVVMYSINVFLTFSLSMLAMLLLSWRTRRRGRVALFLVGFALCITILGVTSYEKFGQGGWVTLAVTTAVILSCFVIRRHYRIVTEKLNALYRQLVDVPRVPDPATTEPDPAHPVAAVLVGGYGGLGLHTLLNVFRQFPGHYKGVVFVSVGVIDSGHFKGEGTVDGLKEEVEGHLKNYVEFARGQGIPAAYRMAIGTEAVDEAARLCLDLCREFPRVTFFAGRVLFERERWYQTILHNETAFAVMKRLQWAAKPVVVIPARLH
jgi:amino acid transporter